MIQKQGCRPAYLLFHWNEKAAYYIVISSTGCSIFHINARPFYTEKGLNNPLGPSNMAVPHNGTKSDDVIESKEKITHCHHIQNKEVKYDTSTAASLAVWLIAWPFRIIQEIWNDYQDGRNMRIRKTKEQGLGTAADAEKIPDSSGYYHENPLARNGLLRPRPVVESWVHQGGEWPWRLDQIVYKGTCDNVRGIWSVEVKDMQAVYWEEDGPDKRISATVSQPHWPFPRQHKGSETDIDNSDGENRDELLEWLRRP
ncbi:hypothetical protein CIB48_g5154 [Xylaria polymorpha]|nr:hypothetical protein CIB48_g5154 [Xylaria polymorpha]